MNFCLNKTKTNMENRVIARLRQQYFLMKDYNWYIRNTALSFPFSPNILCQMAWFSLSILFYTSFIIFSSSSFFSSYFFLSSSCNSFISFHIIFLMIIIMHSTCTLTSSSPVNFLPSASLSLLSTIFPLLSFHFHPCDFFV